MTSALVCPICLDNLHDPVATPCGHLCCDACIKAYARGSSSPYRATCPTCRAPFPLVTLDFTIVPKKYHNFISPPLRRVFLDVQEDNSRAVIENLNVEVAALKARVASLNHDKVLLIDRCDSAHSALTRLRADERTARSENCTARAAALRDQENLDRLRAEYDSLKSHCTRNHPKCWAAVKRTSDQAALDDVSPSSSSSSSNSSSRSEPRSSTWTFAGRLRPKTVIGRRVTSPIPTRSRKRIKVVDFDSDDEIIEEPSLLRSAM